MKFKFFLQKLQYKLGGEGGEVISGIFEMPIFSSIVNLRGICVLHVNIK